MLQDSDTMAPSTSPKPLLHFSDLIQPEHGVDSHLLLFSLRPQARRDELTRTEVQARGRKPSSVAFISHANGKP